MKRAPGHGNALALQSTLHEYRLEQLLGAGASASPISPVKRVTEVYPKCVWLNPKPEEIWARSNVPNAKARRASSR